MAKIEISTSQVGLKALAEEHLNGALDRLGELIKHEDPHIALEASALIIRLARPNSPGVTLGMPGKFPEGWDTPWRRWPEGWDSPWTKWEGGGRAG